MLETRRDRDREDSPGEPFEAVTTTVFGIKAHLSFFDDAIYFVPHYALHRPVARKILRHQYAEPGLHDFVRKYQSVYPGSMIHAGTFFGDMLPSFSRSVSGQIFAFEPVLENYLLARTVVDTNALANVVLFHAGLGRSAATASIETGNRRSHHGGSSRILRAKADVPGEATVQTTALLAIDQFTIDDLVMIQLDVEGFELEVLHGAVCTIEENRPAIILEDNRGNCQDFLERLGYRKVDAVETNDLYLTPERMTALGYA